MQGKGDEGMPTERFYRLPREKSEAIRMAAIEEFKRVAPEEASINRIIRDADISRGSFYTYFEDKNDLLRWIIGDTLKGHQRFYVQRIQENGGDIWDCFEKVLDDSIDRTFQEGFIEIIGNLINSSYFSEMFRESLEEDGKIEISRRCFVRWLYRHCDKNICPVDETGFRDLMEAHQVILMMALRQYFQMKLPREQVRNYYLRLLNMVRYGVCPRETKTD